MISINIQKAKRKNDKHAPVFHLKTASASTGEPILKMKRITAEKIIEQWQRISK